MKTREMKCFLICPVRKADKKQTEAIVDQLEENGWDVHWPPRDTDQKDDVGRRICDDNLEAIKDADVVFIVWDGKSQGCLFDAGMAFALDKKVVCLDLPQLTSDKSFQNTFSHWEGDYDPPVQYAIIKSSELLKNMSAEYHIKRINLKSKIEKASK